MSTDFTIERKLTGHKGRYLIRDGGVDAELTWSVTTPTSVIADHTVVPDSFRGTGAGLPLVTRLVEDARREGFKVMPGCPFVHAPPKRRPEWADALAM